MSPLGAGICQASPRPGKPRKPDSEYNRKNMYLESTELQTVWIYDDTPEQGMPRGKVGTVIRQTEGKLNYFDVEFVDSKNSSITGHATNTAYHVVSIPMTWQTTGP